MANTKLDYTVDMTDPENVMAMNDVLKDQPDPKVIIDMQNTLKMALQPAQVPQNATAMGPAAANASWGKADNA